LKWDMIQWKFDYKGYKMFKTSIKHNKITLEDNGSPIFEGLTPSLVDENLSVIRTKFTNDNNLFNFPFEGENEVEGSLSFLDYEDGIICNLNLKIQHQVSYTFKAFSEKGIKINIDNINKDLDILTFYRVNLWWTEPKHVQNVHEIPENSQVIIFKKGKYYYQLFLLASDGFRSQIKGVPDGCAIDVCSNTIGVGLCNTSLFCLVKDENPFNLGAKLIQVLKKGFNNKIKTKEEKGYPNIFNYLGWCSWNAFYEKINHQGVVEKAQEFKSKNVPVKWFLLDHGWSESNGEKLVSFNEDFKKFPQGFIGLKSILKSMDIDWLGVWQGFNGHWGTLEPDTPLTLKMTKNLMKTNAGQIIPIPEHSKIFHFWNTWHNYLASQGIDFVKIDIQSSLTTLVKGLMYPEFAAREAHLGLEASIAINFNSVCINSMGMSTESILSRPLTSVSRNSNDFFPNKKNNFLKHAFVNAYNSIYHSAFYYCDWDMWWTKHEYALDNAILRAISGGPLYISDVVGETIQKQISPLILSDGFVLRCDFSGSVTEDELLESPKLDENAFKIWNMNKSAGYIGLFNLSQDRFDVKAKFSTKDIPYLEITPIYLLHESIGNSFKVITQNEIIQEEINPKHPKLYSIVPIKDDFACIGLVNKYISTAAIEEVIQISNGKLIILKEGGVFSYFCNKKHSLSVDGIIQKIDLNNKIHQININSLEKSVIELKYI